MSHHKKSLLWIALFAVAFGYVEAGVVVCLRGLLYPEGFAFPLKPIDEFVAVAEIGREVATILMLLAAGMLAGRTRQTRIAFFLLAFGVWDLSYYLWLKVLLDWPVSLVDWDVLFLIPIPWIAPVLAPVVISLITIIAGVLFVRAEERGKRVRVPMSAWVACTLGVGIVLFSFLRDTQASVHFQTPEPYPYPLFSVGVLCLVAALVLTFLWRR